MYIRPLKYSIPTLLFAACTSTGNSAPNETWKVNADWLTLKFLPAKLKSVSYQSFRPFAKLKIRYHSSVLHKSTLFQLTSEYKSKRKSFSFCGLFQKVNQTRNGTYSIFHIKFVYLAAFGSSCSHFATHFEYTVQSLNFKHVVWNLSSIRISISYSERHIMPLTFYDGQYMTLTQQSLFRVTR